MENLIKNKKTEKKSSEYMMIANVARSYNLDKMTQNFIDKHDECNIVNLGASLEASYYRINRKNSIFFEVDPTDVIELREKYLEVGENEKFIKGNLFKVGWCKKLDTHFATLMIVSGLFQYFHERDILKFIADVKNIFENAEVIFDAANRFRIKFTLYVKRTGNSSELCIFICNMLKNLQKKRTAH